MFNKDPRGSRFLIDVKEKSMARWQHNYFDKIPRDNCKNLYIYLYIYRFHFIFLETVSIEIDVMFLFWCENDPGINRMICQSNKSITRITIIEYVLIGYLIILFFLFCRIHKRTIDERWRGSRQIIISLVEFRNDGYDHWKFIYMIDYRI